MQGEEDERKIREHKKKLEDQERTLKEGLKKLKNVLVGKRKMSQSKRESVTSAASKPTVVWIKGGGKNINAGVD